MEISQAEQILRVTVEAKTDELAALQLASKILGDKFSAEFTALTISQAEANQLAIEKNRAILEKEMEKNEKEREKLRADSAEEVVLTKENEIAEKDAIIIKKDEIIATKDAEILELKRRLGEPGLETGLEENKP